MFFFVEKPGLYNILPVVVLGVCVQGSVCGLSGQWYGTWEGSQLFSWVTSIMGSVAVATACHGLCGGTRTTATLGGKCMTWR